ncbi:WD repeat-containing protein 64-like isoform X7 [Ostrea edulis]|uniref:WD repeat-containing protein 64-like isoform X7 n=1 Tax=Ostrea edulis TaxID=37623 RepID=UPI0020965DA9|nr:WD repeat-containing protein 64-like isoform X7 [Ostrea edulis]XP_048734940.1 WD repeat-containing protein 64-like isoform X7 [Ostrea edulis]
MSEVGEQAGDGLARPYTVGTFQTRLDKFESFIKDITYQDIEATPEERRQWITESLRFDQFCDSIRDLFGSDIKNSDLKAIYRKISTNPDAKVDWSELFGYFQSPAEEHEEVAVGEEVSVFTVSKRRRVGEAAGDKTRRDTVQCLRFVPSLDGYVSASQKGAIVIWNSSLRMQTCIDINEAAWVTGCEYLPNIRRAVCCTERSIVVWDHRAKGKNQHVFSIKPFENSPQCICHVPTSSHLHEDMVLFGDDQGYINVLRILSKDLTIKNSKDAEKIQNTQPIPNYPIELDKLSYKIEKRKIHQDWVLKVKYFPELRCFASCSPHSKQSFVLEEIDRLYDDGEVRGVSIYKGVNCFDYCAKANIIATGGVDKVIRVWHPHIFSRPTGKLMGHLFTIVDICCNEKDQHLISLSTARVFRVWDIHTLTCLQVFTDNEERPGEKRIYSMIFDTKHDRLLTGSSVIDSWPLTRAVQDTMQVPHTHDRPISHVILNKELNQVVTMCTESHIKIWELESGKRVGTINNAHDDNVEVTALCLDRSGYRMATGGLDGSIKVWDFGSGQVIKKKSGRQTDEDISIVGMAYTYYQGDRVLLAVGWNNKIKMLLDTNENYDLPVVSEFLDVYYWTAESGITPRDDPFPASEPLPDIGQTTQETMGSRKSSHVGSMFKKDYILSSHDISCFTMYTEDTLITGCTDGTIVFWDVQKGGVEKVFRIPNDEVEEDINSSTKPRSRMGNERRVNMIKVLVHRERKLDPAYVKKMEEEEKEEKEEEKEEVVISQKTSRRVSRANSRASRLSTAPVQVDTQKQKALLDEITAKVEGVELEKTEDLSDEKLEEMIKNDDSEEKRDEEKSEDGLTKGESDEEEIEDEESKYITEVYAPVLVSVHQDSYIRFWTMEGQLLREVSAVTRRTGTPVTSIAHDENCNCIMTGDIKGYLTLWSISKLLKNPESTEQNAVKQLICWRAHLVKIVSLMYIDKLKAIFSGSTDGSVRVWWGHKGRFIGFFSQHRPFVFPKNEESAGPATLPYDITEAPLAPVKVKSAKQKIRTKDNIKFPLVVDYERWQPFRRSAYNRDKQTTSRKKRIPQPEDRKFFGALIKPKDYLKKVLSYTKKSAYNHHLESFNTADKNQGAVFRALPVYRIKTPKKVTIPEPSYKIPMEDESQSYLFGNTSKEKVE